MFVSNKKNCVLIFQKKNITESNNLAPTPPEIKWCVPNDDNSVPEAKRLTAEQKAL